MNFFEIYKLDFFTKFTFKSLNSDFQTQSLIKDTMWSSSLDIYHTLEHLKLYDLSGIKNISLLETLFSRVIEFLPELTICEQLILTSIYQFKTSQPSFDDLIDLFPEYEDELELFEILTYSTDDSLYRRLSLPDTKLYYPEPYVASPSLVHDEV